MSQEFCENLLLVGEVIRPHGRGGLLRIRSYAHSEETFSRAGGVFLRLCSGETYQYKVQSVVRHKGAYLLRLEGLDSLGTAERYRGADILVNKDALGRLDEEEYFWHEIIGLEVYLDTGRFLGTIKHILPTGGNDIYVVEEQEGELLIPAIHEVVREIDLDHKKMIVSEMEGLFDLNEV